LRKGYPVLRISQPLIAKDDVSKWGPSVVEHIETLLHSTYKRRILYLRQNTVGEAAIYDLHQEQMRHRMDCIPDSEINKVNT
jgi:hypothetical protein